jgi:hypothetical protein
MGISQIPIVTFYADRSGFMQGKSPIEDLADLNINWWQSNSDQNIILTVTRFPMLAGKGISEEEADVEVGPGRILWTNNAQGLFYYVEHTGKAIDAGFKHLQTLEDSMAKYGSEFLRKRPDRETATARSIDASESTSPLQDAALRFSDALEQLMDLFAEWMGLETAGTIAISTDFGPPPPAPVHLATLDQARSRGDISMDRFLAELRIQGVLSEDFDFAANTSELDEEKRLKEENQTRQMEMQSKLAARSQESV